LFLIAFFKTSFSSWKCHSLNLLNNAQKAFQIMFKYIGILFDTCENKVCLVCPVDDGDSADDPEIEERAPQVVVHRGWVLEHEDEEVSGEGHGVVEHQDPGFDAVLQEDLKEKFE
jgi:hypothetical protein